MVKALDLLQLMAMSSNPGNMAIFQFFSMAAAAKVDFKIFKFYGWNVQEGQTASLCQISLKSLQPPTADEIIVIFRFFKDGGRRHLGF